MEGQLKRSSLGRTAFIGELYDARSETFSSQSLLRIGYPQSLVTCQEMKDMQYEYKFTEKLSERFDLLKVEAELQVGVLTKLISVSGSGSFLMEESNSAKTVSCTLVCKISTVCEKFFAPFGDIIEHVDLDGLKNPKYTHVVSEIKWGANCLLSLTATCSEESTREELKGELKAQLSMLKGVVTAEGGGNLDKEGRKKELSEEVRIKTCADVVPEGEWPTTVEGFKDFLAKVPKLLEKCNGGKGKPLEYVMIPLKAFREVGRLSIAVDDFVKSIDESFLMSTIFFFEEVAALKRRVNDLVQEMEEMKKYVREKDMKEARSVQEGLAVKESELKRMISEDWVEIRSGKKELRDLIRRVEKFKSCDLKLYSYEEYLDSSSAVLKKLAKVRQFLSKGIVYLGRGDDVECVFSEDPSLEFLVLLVSSEMAAENQDLFNATVYYFLKMVSSPTPSTKYVVVDFDYSEQRNFLDVSITTTTCLRLKNGRILSYDAYIDYVTEILTCFIRLKPQMEFSCSRGRPPNRVPLEMTCPSECSLDTQKWECFHCKTPVEYGFNENFYCSCGSAPATAFDFRCSDVSHGDDFVPISSDGLREALSSLRLLKEMNVLVLGQSGTGKSTWINSIVNYLNFPTMEDARRHGVICTIPMCFVMPDAYESSEKHIVRIGCDQEEEEVAFGHSVTKECHTYNFLWDEMNVRIIDTPGLCDTDGFEQDKINMRNIINHLGYLKELHAVCILLKAGDSRNHTMFCYCIKEILSYLHKDVIKNIVFCFTSARASFYRAGATSALLDNLIRELNDKSFCLGSHNMFYLDNEGFLFLCSLTHPKITHKPEIVSSYKESWNVSMLETLRFFNTIKTFQPHQLKQTLSLVSARNRIMNLSRPIAEISRVMQVNMAQMKRLEKQMDGADQTVKELNKNLTFKEVYLKTEPLEYPRTVCSSPSCIEYLTFPNSDVREIEYKTHCHRVCYLKNVEVATVNNPMLRSCDAMNSTGECSVCGCGWEQHMHTTTSQVRQEREVLNKATQEKIRKEESEKKKLEIFVRDLKTKIEEYDKEYKFIFQASVKFGRFLQGNAIVVYNDKFAECLKYLIAVEENKNHKSATEEQTLKGLKDLLESYKKEVEILLDVIKEGEEQKEVLTVEEVLKLEKDLYKLKHWGKDIKEGVDKEIQADHLMAGYRETPILVSRTTSKAPPVDGSAFSSLKNVKDKVTNFFFHDKTAKKNCSKKRSGH